MKKILFTILTGLSLLAMTSAANASASCTLSITGPSDSRYTYKVTFTVYDLWTTPWSVVGGPSTPAQCYLGMNYLTIPYDVIPDCTDRWYAIATVYQYYNLSLIHI